MSKIDELHREVSLLSEKYLAVQRSSEKYSQAILSGDANSIRVAFDDLRASDTDLYNAFQHAQEQLDTTIAWLEHYCQELRALGISVADTSTILPVARENIKLLVCSAGQLQEFLEHISQAVAKHESRAQEIKHLLVLLKQSIERLRWLGLSVDSETQTYQACLEVAELSEMWDEIFSNASITIKAITDRAERIIADMRLRGQRLLERSITISQTLEEESETKADLTIWLAADWATLAEEELQSSLQRFEQALQASEEEIALSNNPERALRELETLINTHKSRKELILDQRLLRRYGNLLRISATLEKGYSGLTWEAGTIIIEYLKRSTGDTISFFDIYGYSAIKTGLVASLKQGQFLHSLSFLTYKFYTQTDVAQFFEESRSQQIFRQVTQNYKIPPLSIVYMKTLSPQTQEEVITFLEHAKCLDLSMSLRLQLSAALLKALSPESVDHLKASRIFLETLLLERAYIHAYYMYRVLARIHPSLWKEPIAPEIIQGLIDRCINDKRQGMPLLQELCSDNELFEVMGKIESILFLLGSLATHLYNRYGLEQGHSLGWSFVNLLQPTYPQLAEEVMYLLNNPGESTQLEVSEAHQVAQNRFTELVAEVDHAMRKRHYDALLSLEVYRYTVKGAFQPVRDMLTNLSMSPEQVIRKLSNLSPTSLYRDATLILELPMTPSKKRAAETEKKRVLADFQQIIDLLGEAAQHRLELQSQEIPLPEITTCSDGEQKDIEEVSPSRPVLSAHAAWAMQRLLDITK